MPLYLQSGSGWGLSNAWSGSGTGVLGLSRVAMDAFSVLDKALVPLEAAYAFVVLGTERALALLDVSRWFAVAVLDAP